VFLPEVSANIIASSVNVSFSWHEDFSTTRSANTIWSHDAMIRHHANWCRTTIASPSAPIVIRCIRRS